MYVLRLWLQKRILTKTKIKKTKLLPKIMKKLYNNRKNKL